jgi:hypothetical protein
VEFEPRRSKCDTTQVPPMHLIVRTCRITFMGIRGILSAFVAVLMLFVSVSATACDLSCAYNQRSSNCEPPSTRIKSPIEMEGMPHAHDSHESNLDRDNMATYVSSSMGFCHSQPCAKAANLPLQKLRPTAPQSVLAVLFVFAQAPLDHPFDRDHHLGSRTVPGSPSAIERLSTSLRI